MNSKTIYKILKSDEAVSPTFYGVFPSDRLPDKINGGRCSVVANVDTSAGPGSHWVAFYIDQEGLCVYFDSYGRPPCLESFTAFIKRNSSQEIHNQKHLQGPFSSTCGQYSIYFLAHICRGYSLRDIVKAFDEQEDNDEAVTEFVNTRFDVNTETFNVDFILDQISSAFEK